jgi:hypothetical protein
MKCRDSATGWLFASLFNLPDGFFIYGQLTLARPFIRDALWHGVRSEAERQEGVQLLSS